MRTLALTILATASLTVALAQSPPPPPAPTVNAQHEQNLSSVKQQEAAGAQSVTKASATVVNQSQSPQTKSDAQSNTKPDEKDSSAKWWSIVNIVLLTVFNGLLVIVGFRQINSMDKQATYMRDGLAETKRAADSAKDSADAANKAIQVAEQNTAKTERAIVLIEDVSAQPVSGADDYYFSSISVIVVTLKNFGDTAAHSVKLKGKIRFPTCDMDIHDWPPATVPPQGIRKGITWSVGTVVDHNILRTINLGNGSQMSFSIEVTYVDVFGKDHRYTAEGQFIPTLRGFVVTSSNAD